MGLCRVSVTIVSTLLLILACHFSQEVDHGGVCDPHSINEAADWEGYRGEAPPRRIGDLLACWQGQGQQVAWLARQSGPVGGAYLCFGMTDRRGQVIVDESIALRTHGGFNEEPTPVARGVSLVGPNRVAFRIGEYPIIRDGHPSSETWLVHDAETGTRVGTLHPADRPSAIGDHAFLLKILSVDWVRDTGYILLRWLVYSERSEFGVMNELIDQNAVSVWSQVDSDFFSRGHPDEKLTGWVRVVTRDCVCGTTRVGPGSQFQLFDHGQGWRTYRVQTGEEKGVVVAEVD